MPKTARFLPACAIALALFGATVAAGAAEPTVGLQEAHVFSQYSPLAAKWEFSERVLTPTVVDRLHRFEQATGVVAVEHTVDLSRERFDVYVPARKPERGYGLIVWVDPRPAFAVPKDWQRELDERGIALVAARRSGNGENIYERRMPLALHGLANMDHLLPLDPERIYVAGFSGGARVAQRLAMAYADVFRGVMLVASSDPFGEPGLLGGPPVWPPVPELMDRFRSHSRVVFVTGTGDLVNRARNARTRTSMRAFCVAGVTDLSIARLGHAEPDRRGLARALDALERPRPAAPVDAACVARLQREIDGALDRVEGLLDAGKAKEAGVALGAVDDRYGGLAGERAILLDRRIHAAVQPAAMPPAAAKPAGG